MRLLATALLFAALLPTDASAASMKCGTDLVSDGASKLEVFKKCGEPFGRETRYVTDTISYLDYSFGTPVVLQRQITRTIEEWVYTFGSHDFDKHVIFDDGRLVEVRSGNYGR